MNVLSYIAVGLLTIAAGAIVAGGEPAMAELRLAEASAVAAVAGFSAVSLLVAPAVAASSGASTAID